ncbi:cyclin-J [Caerostris darwini]|uniref:Cyclin-J n=1 Tax=Caerostris darwini TaxID=1538125 RepID=A0AAV4PHQ5_9ARAC|nr:cyclin-J [Caerostris darwini]
MSMHFDLRLFVAQDIYFLMTTEKDWCVGEYAEDIHKYLRSKERKRFLFRGQSPQLHMRKKLVQWMDTVCQKMKFCTTVQHLAVYLLDIFMDNHTIQCDHLHMVVVGCLIVAVKLEENDNLIPKNSDLNALLGNKYKLIEFVQMEVSVLNFFNWDVLFPTAAHFAEYYALFAIQPTDTLQDKSLSDYDLVKVYVNKYINYFLEVTIQDPIFINFCPSIVAASCVASARVCLSLSPPWPMPLQNRTYYKYPQMKPCMDLLQKALETDMAASRKGLENISDMSHYVNTNGPTSSIPPDCIVMS